MKKILTRSALFTVVCYLFLLSSCKPDEEFNTPVLGFTEMGIVTEATADCISLITSDGGNKISARGVCWSTTPEPTIENDTTFDAYGKGKFSSTLRHLSPNTTYYVRAYATNKGGTAYGVQTSFTTKTYALSTLPARAIKAQSTICGGVVSSNGDSLTVTERGICWSTGNNPTLVSGKKVVDRSRVDSFRCMLTNLLPNTTYYARAYAINSLGITYGDEITFTTRQGIATVTTLGATVILKYSASLEGTITDDGGATITERGFCWSKNIDPTVYLDTRTLDGSGVGKFSDMMTGLAINTTYYVRAYATNSVGTFYGENISFRTLGLAGRVTDIDGNVYHFVTIGNQAWMVENLKTTKYRDGTPIPNVTSGTEWSKLTTGAYGDYNNNASNGATYGHLYNWYAVMDSRNIAPAGWHVPSQEEWATLKSLLSSGIYAGKMKETGTAHWATYTGANNETGFTALPGGSRSGLDGTYGGLGSFGYWWSTDGYLSPYDSRFYIWYFELRDNSNSFYEGDFTTKNHGYSVRCLMD